MLDLTSLYKIPLAEHGSGFQTLVGKLNYHRDQNMFLTIAYPSQEDTSIFSRSISFCDSLFIQFILNCLF